MHPRKPWLEEMLLAFGRKSTFRVGGSASLEQILIQPILIWENPDDDNNVICFGLCVLPDGTPNGYRKVAWHGSQVIVSQTSRDEELRLLDCNLQK